MNETNCALLGPTEPMLSQHDNGGAVQGVYLTATLYPTIATEAKCRRFVAAVSNHSKNSLNFLSVNCELVH